MTTFLSAIVAMLLAIPPFPVAAGDTGEYTFTISRDGEPVGQHRFAFERQGDRVEIDVNTRIDVSLAFITLFAFEHERHEVWQDGRALRIDATTNDNGDELEITVRPDGNGGYVRTINGRVDRFDGSTGILAFWNKDTFRYDSYFSIMQDKTFEASFQYIGRDEVTVAGEAIEAEHYRMVGDEERDLWFDMNGHVAKARFRRRGSAITYLRDPLTPREPRSDACAVPC